LLRHEIKYFTSRHAAAKRRNTHLKIEVRLHLEGREKHLEEENTSPLNQDRGGTEKVRTYGSQLSKKKKHCPKKKGEENKVMSRLKGGGKGTGLITNRLSPKKEHKKVRRSLSLRKGGGKDHILK